MEAILKDYKNWIKIDAKGMKNVSELELATIVYNTAHAELESRISPDDILCAQLFEKEWIVYCSGQVAKARILSVSTVTVQGKTFQMNEFSQKSTRISIHGLPLHITDREVETWVDSFAVRVTNVQKHDVMTKVKEASCFTKLWSGHRFCYASSIYKDVPRFTTYDMPDPMQPTELKSANVTIYFNDQTINCKYCKEPTHKIDDCPILATKKSKVKCYACSAMGHRSQECPATLNTHAFNGVKNKLSNFYPCDIEYENVRYPSSEHLYQWQKAVFHDMYSTADSILNADSAWEAKKLGDKVKIVPAWEDNQVKIMEKCLNAKLEQCSAFKEELMSTGERILVECTKNTFWGSGLSREDTLKKEPHEWPGSNKMGCILTKLRENSLNVSAPAPTVKSIQVQDDIHSSGHCSSSVTASNVASFTEQSTPQSIAQSDTQADIITSDQPSESETNTIDQGEKDNEAVSMAINILDKAMGPETGLSPELLETVKSYLEKISTPNDGASPSLKRKEITPNTEQNPTKKEKNTKEKTLKKAKSTGGIKKFLTGKTKK